MVNQYLTFHANEVIKVPQYDIAIVHTKENHVEVY